MVQTPFMTQYPPSPPGPITNAAKAFGVVHAAAINSIIPTVRFRNIVSMVEIDPKNIVLWGGLVEKVAEELGTSYEVYVLNVSHALDAGIAAEVIESAYAELQPSGTTTPPPVLVIIGNGIHQRTKAVTGMSTILITSDKIRGGVWLPGSVKVAKNKFDKSSSGTVTITFTQAMEVIAGTDINRFGTYEFDLAKIAEYPMESLDAAIADITTRTNPVPSTPSTPPTTADTEATGMYARILEVLTSLRTQMSTLMKSSLTMLGWVIKWIVSATYSFIDGQVDKFIPKTHAIFTWARSIFKMIVVIMIMTGFTIALLAAGKAAAELTLASMLGFSGTTMAVAGVASTAAILAIMAPIGRSISSMASYVIDGAGSWLRWAFMKDIAFELYFVDVILHFYGPVGLCKGGPKGGALPECTPSKLKTRILDFLNSTRCGKDSALCITTKDDARAHEAVFNGCVDEIVQLTITLVELRRTTTKKGRNNPIRGKPMPVLQKYTGQDTFSAELISIISLRDRIYKVILLHMYHAYGVQDGKSLLVAISKIHDPDYIPVKWEKTTDVVATAAAGVSTAAGAIRSGMSDFVRYLPT